MALESSFVHIRCYKHLVVGSPFLGKHLCIKFLTAEEELGILTPTMYKDKDR